MKLPFNNITSAIIRLMEQRGFQVARGTYAHHEGTMPTWNITRPDSPQWRGMWAVWFPEPESIEESEEQTLFALCMDALHDWDNYNIWTGQPA